MYKNFAIIFSLFVVYFFIHYLYAAHLIPELQSDAIYPYLFSLDLHRGFDYGAGWQITPAPYIFPDIFIFYMITAFTQDIFLVYLWALLIQGFLLFLGFFQLFKIAVPEAPQASTVFVAMWPSIAVICFRFFGIPYDNTDQSLYFYTHHGAMISIGLFVTAWSWKFIFDHSWSCLGWSFVLSILTGASDPVFFVAFLAPIGLAVIIVRGSPPRPQMLSRILTLCIADIAIVLLSQSLKSHIARFVSIPDAHGSFSLNSTNPILNVLIETYGRLSQSGIGFAVVAVTLVCILFTFVYRLKQQFYRQLGGQMEFVVICLVLSIMASMLLTPLFIEGSAYMDSRYRVTAFLFPFALLSLSLLVLPKLFQSVIAGICFTTLLYLTFISGQQLFDKYQTLRFNVESIAPQDIKCVLSMADRHQITRGYSDYWQAKRLRAWSQGRLQVINVNGNLDPSLWINNRFWFLKNKRNLKISSEQPIKENLLVIKTFDVSNLKSPDMEKNCGNLAVQIYLAKGKL